MYDSTYVERKSVLTFIIKYVKIQTDNLNKKLKKNRMEIFLTVLMAVGVIILIVGALHMIDLNKKAHAAIITMAAGGAMILIGASNLL
jgi:uncharacterized membrane protein